MMLFVLSKAFRTIQHPTDFALLLRNTVQLKRPFFNKSNLEIIYFDLQCDSC